MYIDFNGLCCNYFATLLFLYPHKCRLPKAGNSGQCDRKVAFENCTDLTEVEAIVTCNFKMPFWRALNSRRRG